MCLHIISSPYGTCTIRLRFHYILYLFGVEKPHWQASPSRDSDTELYRSMNLALGRCFLAVCVELVLTFPDFTAVFIFLCLCIFSLNILQKPCLHLKKEFKVSQIKFCSNGT